GPDRSLPRLSVAGVLADVCWLPARDAPGRRRLAGTAWPAPQRGAVGLSGSDEIPEESPRARRRAIQSGMPFRVRLDNAFAPLKRWLRPARVRKDPGKPRSFRSGAS